MSAQIKDLRSSMEEDKELGVFMAGLRGSNIDDSDFAGEGVSMMLVTVGSPPFNPHQHLINT
jgi:aarF domain-containing kinase